MRVASFRTEKSSSRSRVTTSQASPGPPSTLSSFVGPVDQQIVGWNDECSGERRTRGEEGKDREQQRDWTVDGGLRSPMKTADILVVGFGRGHADLRLRRHQSEGCFQLFGEEVWSS